MKYSSILVVILSLLGFVHSLEDLRKFESKIMGSFIATGTIRTLVDVPLLGIGLPDDTVPTTFYFDFVNNRSSKSEYFRPDRFEETEDGQGIFWYLSNGTYIQYLFAPDNATCWFQNSTFAEQMQNYAGHRLMRTVADPDVGEVHQYKGMIRDNGYCDMLYFSEIDVKKDGDVYNWVTWQTQSPFKIDGTPFGMAGTRIPVKASAVYQFTSWKHEVPDASSFALPQICWNPKVEGYCERYFPELKECKGF